MVELITFPSATKNASLPLLIAGQSQKEFFLNQALAMIDALVTRGVDASLADPPLEPNEGSTYRVEAAASGDWTGHEDQIAIQIGGSWAFISPWEGMSVFDRSVGQQIMFSTSWNSAVEPSEPTGGSVIDVEARAGLTAVIEALRISGLFPSTT